MSRRLQTVLVVAIVFLAVGFCGIAAYLFLGSGALQPKAAAKAPPKEVAVDACFLQLDHFVTNLADADRARYVDVTVALAMKDEKAVEAAAKLEPKIRDVILSQLRIRVASDFTGAAGKDDLAKALEKSLSGLLNGNLQKAYVTDLIIQ